MESEKLCARCGHRKAEHENPNGKPTSCRGAKLRARGISSEGEEYKSDVITTAMPAPPCDCSEFEEVK